ncbi:MAG: hypothetical protein VKN33_03080 [Candidatus Sericytochromatia bacterium]|nr:hypothetical protein [Candidatus Sericytochromatia bacterium]
MFIDPRVHERFVKDFGLNMLNTLTSKSLRLTAHRRKIHVFDERGGVMGGRAQHIQTYKNMTTGVFHSKTKKVVGVRYRCDPDAIDLPALGAFHTHPALFDEDPRRVRRRIDRLLWLSDLDIEAFRQQHRVFGYQWHFIGCIDIACFSYRDLQRGTLAPRYILRYPNLERIMEALRAEIAYFDGVLRNASNASRLSNAGDVRSIFFQVTALADTSNEALATLEPALITQMSRRVAQECQLQGLTKDDLQYELEQLLPGVPGQTNDPLNRSRLLKDEIIASFHRLASLE